MARGKVTVAHRGVGEGGEPVPTEIIAESIVELSQGMKKMRAGKLNDKAVGILLAHATGLGQGTCLTVLQALEDLEALYLKKKEKA